MHKTLLNLAAALTLAMTAFASTAVSAQEEKRVFDDEHLRAARAAIIATRSMVEFDNLLPGIASRTASTFTRKSPDLAQVIETTVDEVAFEFVKRRSDLTRTLMEVWARRFSREELVSITLFFKTPVGRKYGENKQPLDILSIGAAKQWSDLIAEDMVTEVRKKLAAAGHPF